MTIDTHVSMQYEPHLAQRAFHEGRGKYKFRACFCGTGGGKTIAGLGEALAWCRNYGGIVGHVYEPTYPMVRRILIPTLESDLFLGAPLEINPVVKEYNRSERRIEFINSSTLWFGSLEEPEYAEGTNLDFVVVDEARLVRHFATAWLTLRRRLRGSGHGKFPIGAWITTTPDAPTIQNPDPNASLYNFFENPHTKVEDAQIYRWGTAENPHLPAGYVADVSKAHTGGLAERFLFGRFADVAGGSFKFDSTIHILNIAPAVENMTRIVYGVDFGWTSPSAVVAVGLDGDGRAYVLDEFYAAQTPQEGIASAIKDMQGRLGAGVIYCDPSEPAMIDYLKRQKLDARPNSSKREDGIRLIGGRLEKAGDGRARLYISKSCVNIIDEMLTYDEKRKEHDHACLAAGTMVKTEHGLARIEDIRLGMNVITRDGLQRVKACGVTGISPVVTLLSSQGCTLTGTPNHPVYVRGRGFIPLDTISYGDTLFDLSHLRGMVQKNAAVALLFRPNLKVPVYNLTIEHSHEFFGNGLLVSNCDALRYALVMGAEGGRSIPKLEIRRW